LIEQLHPAAAATAGDPNDPRINAVYRVLSQPSTTQRKPTI